MYVFFVVASNACRDNPFCMGFVGKRDESLVSHHFFRKMHFTSV